MQSIYKSSPTYLYKKINNLPSNGSEAPHFGMTPSKITKPLKKQTKWQFWKQNSGKSSNQRANSAQETTTRPPSSMSSQPDIFEQSFGTITSKLDILEQRRRKALQAELENSKLNPLKRAKIEKTLTNQPRSASGLREALQSHPAVPNALLETHEEELKSAINSNDDKKVIHILNGIEGAMPFKANIKLGVAVHNFFSTACGKGNMEIIEAFLAAPGFLKPKKERVNGLFFRSVMFERQPKVAKRFLQTGLLEQKEIDRGLHTAVYNNDLEIVNILLQTSWKNHPSEEKIRQILSNNSAFGEIKTKLENELKIMVKLKDIALKIQGNWKSS